MDLIELIEAFLAAKYHALSPNTRRAYRYDLIACAQVLPTLPIREITVSHLRLCVRVSAGLTSRICWMPIPPPNWKPFPSASATHVH
jgi:hypothetical protein